MSTVSLDGASGFLVRAKNQRAGIVLLTTIYGVNPFVRDFATMLATDGISTLIWDPYPDEPLPQGLDAAVKRAEQLRDTPSLDAMSICIDFMLDELRLNAVGTIGFCLGGRYCLMLAARDQRLGACVSIYPTIHTPRSPNQDEDVVSRAAEIACPVQLIYPGRDHITTHDTFFRLQQMLQRREAATVVQLHPQAGHGFLHNDAPENQTAKRQARPLVSAFLTACLA